MDIGKIIENFESREQPKLDKMYEYYRGKHKITGTIKPKGKPNNKLVANYAKNIVNNTVGFYLGKPVSYTTDDTELQEQIAKITKYNDDAFHNTMIGKDLSIYGRAAEILYLDEDENIRYSKLDPRYLKFKLSNDVEKKLEYVVRWYDVIDETTGNVTRYAEAYFDDVIKYYESSNGSSFKFKNKKEHFFGQIPVNIYENNEDGVGDFDDDVISLIDAYNTVTSENVNDYVKFANALLAIKGMIPDETTKKDMRDNNILQLIGDGTAQWLTKQTNDADVVNIAARIERDIYMSSQTVNMSDENFANSDSGISMAYKLMCMGNRISGTEHFFKKGLLRRFELICHLLNLKGANYDYTSIGVTFSRNLPKNLLEIADVIERLSGTVSLQTLLAQIPFVENPQEELERVEREQKKYPSIFSVPTKTTYTAESE